MELSAARSDRQSRHDRAGREGELDRSQGFHGWWITNADIATRAGDTSELRFAKDGAVITMRFRIGELIRDRVAWTCTENTAPLWVGTKVTWSIDPSPGPGPVEVTLTHDGWQATGPWFQESDDTWLYFMGSLKSYVETGVGTPAH
jgi:hypothetical protein